jgi:hypothetical protein
MIITAQKAASSVRVTRNTVVIVLARVVDLSCPGHGSSK